jgi:hypothetical protein
MPDDAAFPASFKPLTITIKQTIAVTNESRTKVYERIGRGEYVAVKSDGRTLVLFESVERRIASLPRAEIKPPRPRKRMTDHAEAS